MKKILQAGVWGVVLAAGLAASGARADDKGVAATEKALQSMYVSFLNEKGFDGVAVDKDGDVEFRDDKFTFFIAVTEKDPQFFQVVLPAFWSLDSAEERARAFMAVNKTNSQVKAAKLYVVNNNTWVSVEMFVEKPEDFKAVFDRSKMTLLGAARVYAQAMRESESE